MIFKKINNVLINVFKEHEPDLVGQIVVSMDYWPSYTSQSFGMATKKILDACCGGRMMWFDKHHPDVLYVDSRKLECDLFEYRNFSDHRHFSIKG
ncbi:hypothetical protein NO1_1754 [Candidatus Termititenax aidoneus]|uniref:Uncharacterized protein n=1 Tax=Termititenax aidoneus TaxID=2218524 RepID=A0A388TDH7_TERA1|nr:hypothetical protein NO1_1754 [Candidatus Termititenax aidoneus]